MNFRVLAGAACAAVLMTLQPASAANLLHAYDFNGSTVQDLVGSEDGTLMNGATVSGGVLNLDGVNDYVQFSTHLVPTGSDPYSVYVRVETPQPPSNYTEIISQGYSGAGFYIGSSNTGTIRLTDSHTNTGVLYPSGEGFHDLLLTNGAGGFNFSIDGVTVFSDPVAATTTALGDDTHLGSQFYPGIYGEFFHGSIDSLRIYDGAVTLAQATGPIGGVPEPGAWTLMMLGVGVVGGLLRRQRNAALA